MTEEEMSRAKTMLKDKVKDQTQALLDEARDSVNDTVSVFCFSFPVAVLAPPYAIKRKK